MTAFSAAPTDSRKKVYTVTVSEAQKKAIKKYQTEKTDEFKIRVAKGQKDIIKAFAEKNGESLNQFVVRLIAEAMQNDKGL